MSSSWLSQVRPCVHVANRAQHGGDVWERGYANASKYISRTRTNTRHIMQHVDHSRRTKQPAAKNPETWGAQPRWFGGQPPLVRKEGRFHHTGGCGVRPDVMDSESFRSDFFRHTGLLSGTCYHMGELTKESLHTKHNHKQTASVPPGRQSATKLPDEEAVRLIPRSCFPAASNDCHPCTLLASRERSMYIRNMIERKQRKPVCVEKVEKKKICAKASRGDAGPDVRVMMTSTRGFMHSRGRLLSHWSFLLRHGSIIMLDTREETHDEKKSYQVSAEKIS